MRSIIEVCALVVVTLIRIGSSACVPEVPQKLVSDPTILDHPAITSAFRAIEKNLDGLFVNTTTDGLSFAIVGAA